MYFTTSSGQNGSGRRGHPTANGVHRRGRVTEVAYDNTLVSFAGGLQLFSELRQLQSNLRHLADGIIRDISLTSDFIIARNSPQVVTAQELGSAVSTVP
jgi:hypothetical protein